jgi:hypothetical protein
MALTEDWDNDDKAKDMQGAFVIKPGERWSFNDKMNNLKDYTGTNGVVNLVPLENKYAKIKAPWNPGNFDYITDKNVTGGGWCELGTSIRESAVRLVGTNGKSLTPVRYEGANSNPPPKPKRPFQTAKGGFDGPIRHWTHSGVTEDSYNRQLLNPSRPDLRLQDKRNYVLIWNVPADTSEPNDGDLVITNPNSVGSDIDLILTIQLDDKGMVTVETFFGKKGTTPEQGPR